MIEEVFIIKSYYYRHFIHGFYTKESDAKDFVDKMNAASISAFSEAYCYEKLKLLKPIVGKMKEEKNG